MGGQVVEYAELGGLLLGRAARARGGSRHASEMQGHLTVFGDSISDGAFELGGERKHGAKDFTDWRQIVVRDPAAETKQGLVEDGSCIEHADDFFRCDRRLAIMQLNDDARHALLAEWDEDA